MDTPLVWGTFTPQHLLTLALIPVAFFLLLRIGRWKRRRLGTVLLFLCSLWGDVAIVYNLLMWNDPLQYLPLHFCSINALLLPIAILWRSKTLGNLLPPFGICALIALILNVTVNDIRLPSWVFIMYYVPHLMEFCIPFIIVLTGRVRFSLRQVPWSTLCVGLMAAVVHTINCFVNKWYLQSGIVDSLGNAPQVNYMFTVSPDGMIILNTLWDWIPHSFWYLLPLLSVFAAVMVLCCVLFRSREPASEQLRNPKSS